MEKFINLDATAVVIAKDNIDTDQLLPKQFLTGISRAGYGEHLLFDWRYVEGDPNNPDPSFVLNTKQGKNAKILISGKNFGCGSSREHAPWALSDYGFRALIAESFADIFYNNCVNNGILPITLSKQEITDIKKAIKENSNTRLSINLPNQTVSIHETQLMKFEIKRSVKENLLNGWDKIGKTLSYTKEIVHFEANQAGWLKA